jgi:hypothetical protein
LGFDYYFTFFVEKTVKNDAPERWKSIGGEKRHGTFLKSGREQPNIVKINDSRGSHIISQAGNGSPDPPLMGRNDAVSVLDAQK